MIYKTLIEAHCLIQVNEMSKVEEGGLLKKIKERKWWHNASFVKKIEKNKNSKRERERGNDAL